MAFDWLQYINLAEELVSSDPSTEAKLRSATSRAYYGAFIRCRSKSPHSSIKAGEVHFKVINHFKRDGASRNELSISSSLDALRIRRNDADYDTFYKATKPETSNHVNMAKSILRLLAEID